MLTYVLHLSLRTRMIFVDKNPFPPGIITRLFPRFYFPNIIRLSFSTCSFRILSIRQFHRSFIRYVLSCFPDISHTPFFNPWLIYFRYLHVSFVAAKIDKSKFTSQSLPTPSIILSYILFILNGLSRITANEAYKNYFETQTIIDNHDKKIRSQEKNTNGILLVGEDTCVESTIFRNTVVICAIYRLDRSYL